MKNKYLRSMVLLITFSIILIPVVIISIWSFAERWPWPYLFPEDFSLRTLKELFYGSNPLPSLLFSSITISAVVSIIATVIALMTSRALEFYDFRGKSLVLLSSVLPLAIPGTFLAMGLQTVFLKLGIADTILSVIIIHTIAAIPYSVTILNDVTHSVGTQFEEQSQVLGASVVKSFFLISLPLMKPGIISSASMAFIMSYSQYFSTLVIGGGQVKTLALVMFPYIQSGDRPLMSIYSLVFVFSALIVFLIMELIMRRSYRSLYE